MANNKFQSFKKSIHILVLLMIAGRIPETFGQASLLKTLQTASKAVVTVHAQSAAVAQAKPQAYVDEQSGAVYVRRTLIPLIAERSGAGVILDRQGIIVTNAHTVRQATALVVTLHDGSKQPAKLIHIAPEHDLAFLWIAPPKKPLPTVTLADSSQIRLQERIFSLGHSQFLKNTISEGYINGIGLKKGEKRARFFQVTFDIYPGDSGSPIFDERGRLLGIMIAAARNQPKESYAVTSNMILEILKKIESHAKDGSESA